MCFSDSRGQNLPLQSREQEGNGQGCNWCRRTIMSDTIQKNGYLRHFNTKTTVGIDTTALQWEKRLFTNPRTWDIAINLSAKQKASGLLSVIPGCCSALSWLTLKQAALQAAFLTLASYQRRQGAALTMLRTFLSEQAQVDKRASCNCFKSFCNKYRSMSRTSRTTRRA